MIFFKSICHHLISRGKVPTIDVALIGNLGKTGLLLALSLPKGQSTYKEGARGYLGRLRHDRKELYKIFCVVHYIHICNFRIISYEIVQLMVCSIMNEASNTIVMCKVERVTKMI